MTRKREEKSAPELDKEAGERERERGTEGECEWKRERRAKGGGAE